MNKSLPEEVMKRSQLRNNFLRGRTVEIERMLSKQEKQEKIIKVI